MRERGFPRPCVHNSVDKIKLGCGDRSSFGEYLLGLGVEPQRGSRSRRELSPTTLSEPALVHGRKRRRPKTSVGDEGSTNVVGRLRHPTVPSKSS